MIAWAVRLLDDKSDITETLTSRVPPERVLAALRLSSAVQRKTARWALGTRIRSSSHGGVGHARLSRRIGRTGRAGRSGFAITLCDAEQRAWLHDVEREIGRTLTVQDDHEWHCEVARHSTKRAPVLGGGPVKQVKPEKAPRERKVWTEEEKLAARMAAKAA